jgi:hypothetical protein
MGGQNNPVTANPDPPIGLHDLATMVSETRITTGFLRIIPDVRHSRSALFQQPLPDRFYHNHLFPH